ncbi:erythromycin esterase family protein [Hymenobacter busanensis]|uniref:erythromycin esterase family protein n=1 Tax=Hymenobacter busanensis TaxID=2607656 RepID=UPI001F030E26|nr:erythromycin esterase family protein [Hymenobacter busanensis]
MASAQLPVHAVRSISPADDDFTDLAFLTQEIGDARVVMLGEPTHGEGNVFEAKARLLRFLHSRLGFNTVGFESGFYELDKAQRELHAGVPAAEAISRSVFGIWTGTREFQAVLPLLGPGRLGVMGFDPQLSGDYQESLLEELEEFLKPEKGADAVAYDYLDACLATMGEHFIFPPTHNLALFELQLGKARKLLDRVATGPSAPRRVRAVFWLQNLRSLQALARDYAHNDPSAKSGAEFTATDSNPRDAQMADNLLWYLRQHPQAKVVCWGALPHLANKFEGFADAELRSYRPMGQAVKAALGPDAVYVLGTLAGSGSYQNFGEQQVPTPAAGSLEADLLAQGHNYAFVSLKHDLPGRQLTTYAFEYKPVTGPWSETVDGFLFLKTVNPPHPAGGETPSTPPAAEAAPARLPGRLTPATRPMATADGATRLVSGTVLDRTTGQPVPFATVAVPVRSTGTVADASGRFRLETQAGENVQISSIGYEPVTIAAAGTSGLVVRLVPAAFALAAVHVSAQSQDPRRIMKKVIRAGETNYGWQDEVCQVYTHRRFIDFDTLRHDIEYVSQVFNPAGWREWGGGFLLLGPKQVHKVLEKHVVSGSAAGLNEYGEGGHGFLSAGADPVRISPLFKLGKLGKYALQLDTIEQRHGEGYYVVRFAVKRANHRSTGMYHAAGYSGKVYIRQRDYAVVRYEALWQNDTVLWNATARKCHGRSGLVAKLYPQVYSDHRKAHVVTYEQGANGRYHIASSVAQALNAGHVLGGKAFYTQKSCEAYFEPLPAEALATRPDAEKEPALRGGEIWQLTKTEYRPAFWATFRRPVPAEAAPALDAKKP